MVFERSAGLTAGRDIYPVRNVCNVYQYKQYKIYAPNNLKVKGEAGFADDQIQCSGFVT